MGAVATQGFGYQQWWAALTVAELLESPDDFAIGLEVKEDIALLDSATAPTRVEFCQVKTNEQAVAWTFSELHKKGKKLKGGGYQLSVLAKLYHRRRQFKDFETKLIFVSNTSFKIPNDSGGNENSHDVNLNELPTSGKDMVIGALAAQLSLSIDDIQLSDVRLHRSNLPLGEQALFVSGKLSQLAFKGLLSCEVTQPLVAATMLASEIQSKASNTSYATCFEDLKNKRFFSRADAISILTSLSGANETITSVFDDAVNRLNIECYDYTKIKGIRTQRVRICADAVDRTNSLFRKQAEAILICETELKTTPTLINKQLGCFLDAVVSKVMTACPEEFENIDTDYLHALTLMIIYHGIDLNIFATQTGSKSEAKQ